MHRKGRAILPAATHFATDADNLFDAGLYVVVDVTVVLRPIRLGHEDLDVLADKLVSRIPEQPFGRRVDRLDQAAVIDGDDGGNRRLQDPPQFRGLACSRGSRGRNLRHAWLPQGHYHSIGYDSYATTHNRSFSEPISIAG